LKVQIVLPPLRPLYTVVERYRCVNPFVCVAANKEGKMSLRVESALATVSTFYSNLDNPPFSFSVFILMINFFFFNIPDNPTSSSSYSPSTTNADGMVSSSSSSANPCEVRLDIRKFSRLFLSYLVSPSKAVACFLSLFFFFFFFKFFFLGLFNNEAFVMHVLGHDLYIIYEIPHVNF
jgi:hypothetical protein